MSFRHDLVLFDLDGTLTDSAPGITGGLKEAFQKIGWPVPPRETLRKFIGPPVRNKLNETYPEMNEEAVSEFIRFYRDYYNSRGAYENSVYPGIMDLLAQLKAGGVLLAVATSKPATPAKRVLDHFGLAQPMDYISTEDDSESGRGKEHLILPVLEQSGVPASRAVMVGDTKYDAGGARRAGTDFVGVLYGFGSQEEMEREGAENFVGSVEELRDFLVDK
ncbi:hypothetical protein A7X67_00660 [Clostridium sp. W14A]|uniref:HAD hydrolase-like protein n=1 Tax=Caproicibacter fermentans TaxID=2576756 RepID=A0A7G8T754_9FIRM|nr:HAD hydrolase-like protein [Caproicibacter fermentans]OCN01640.1 hypothetical protein A7X67_00660 [Clostridium sp. W14A]QNK39445.1 HAD hydrolase-like protein [Caproicibacter fermentans]